jgi:uncharacterized protein with HEPN domain
MSHDKAYLHDIVESFERAMGYLGTLTVSQLAADQEKQDAIIRRIEIVGEATKRLSEDLRSANPQVPWREMAGMRDILIHGYDRVDVVRIHSAVTMRMPELIDELKRIRDALPDPD